FIHPNVQAEVSVTDLIGQTVFSSGSITAPSTAYKIDITDSPDGIYILRVKYNDRIFTSRLVVTK
ncbi:MAG TPA: T9SS type A sorting domain-containing protein, partial [Bacteroidia bacterium]|nr:T9SS type A sorting domain-containing protein [Bacteroidia bacterium]